MEQQITNQEIIEKLKQIESTMITKKELEEAIETTSVLSNKDTMNQINGSNEDILDNKSKEIDSVEDL